MMRHLITAQLKPLLAIFVIVLVAASAVLAQPTPRDLQTQAEDALVEGRPAETLRLANAMLELQPDNFAGLYLLALAHADLRDFQSVTKAGARAYSAAPTEDTRFEVAQLVAGAHFQLKNHIRSAFWLRRAASHTNNENDLQTLATAYAATTDANLLSFRLEASIAPTDNINDGSEEGVLRLEGIDLTFVLPEDQRSLSGVAISASTELRYRLSRTPNQMTELIGAISGEGYFLSQDAKDLLASSPNPSVRALRGSDFATTTVTLGIQRQQNNISPLGPVRFGLTLGTYLEGNERLVDFRDVSLEQIIPVTPRNVFRIKAVTREQNARQPQLLDATLYDVTGIYDRVLQNNSLLRLSLRGQRYEAGNENSFDEYEIGVAYGHADPVWGVEISTSLNLGYRNFEEFVTTLDGREDWFMRAEATATFPEYSYFGFSPSITLSSSRTQSSAEENTSSALAVLFGVQSNF